MRRAWRTSWVAVTPLLLAGCAALVGGEDVTRPEAGFSTVAANTDRAIGKDVVWIQNREQARAAAERTRALTHRKTITADTAVQVALLNNKGLQAAYAELGLSSADLWQQTMPANPKVAVGAGGIGAPEVSLLRAIEATVTANLLALATRGKRMEISDLRFQQAKLRAAEATLRVAADTRRSWIDAVSAVEQLAYLDKARQAADAASELAQKLGETGAMPKAEQARNHAFFAELAGQRAQAKLSAGLAREKLTRMMGLWGDGIDYWLPGSLPPLPGKLVGGRTVEADALRQRIDLRIARLELEALAASHGLTDATRLVTDLELMAGIEAEREREDGKTRTRTTGLAELEFEIPIFDSGQARLRKAELAYMRAVNQLAEKAVNVRSEARSAHTAYRSRHEIARHYRDKVLPLRVDIEQESVLTYNGMITNTFELLADIRARTGAGLAAATARRDFWLARTDLTVAIHGGGGPVGGGGGDVALAAESSGGH